MATAKPRVSPRNSREGSPPPPGARSDSKAGRRKPAAWTIRASLEPRRPDRRSQRSRKTAPQRCGVRLPGCFGAVRWPFQTRKPPTSPPSCPAGSNVCVAEASKAFVPDRGQAQRATEVALHLTNPRQGSNRSIVFSYERGGPRREVQEHWETRRFREPATLSTNQPSPPSWQVAAR